MPSSVPVLARLPLDPLVRECEACAARTMCSPDRFALVECEAPPGANKAAARLPTVEERILTVVQPDATFTLLEIMALTGISYRYAYGICDDLWRRGALSKEIAIQHGRRVALFSKGGYSE